MASTPYREPFARTSPGRRDDLGRVTDRERAPFLYLAVVLVVFAALVWATAVHASEFHWYTVPLVALSVAATWFVGFILVRDALEVTLCFERGFVHREFLKSTRVADREVASARSGPFEYGGTVEFLEVRAEDGRRVFVSCHRSERARLAAIEAARARVFAAIVERWESALARGDVVRVNATVSVARGPREVRVERDEGRLVLLLPDGARVELAADGDNAEPLALLLARRPACDMRVDAAP